MVTKTPQIIQGDMVCSRKITIDMTGKNLTRGFSISGHNYSGTATIADIFTQLSAAERDAVQKFIKIGTRMAANAGIQPDTPLIDENIGDEL